MTGTAGIKSNTSCRVLLDDGERRLQVMLLENSRNTKFQTSKNFVKRSNLGVLNLQSAGTSTQQAGSVRFRPCIDIHKGKVKQIVGSTLRDLDSDVRTSAAGLITNFESEKPAEEYAELYKQDGLVGGHIIMLGADAASRSAAIRALEAYPGGMQLGGGVNLENAKFYLDAGASHVIVTSYVINQGVLDEERLRDLVKHVGKKRIVLDLSCRKKDGVYMVVTDRWQKFSSLAINEESLAFLAQSADEFLVHGVDVEGKRLGIDEDLVMLLGKCSPIRVTYAGGVTTLNDLELIKAAGSGGVDVTVGSSLDIFGEIFLTKMLLAGTGNNNALNDCILL